MSVREAKEIVRAPSKFACFRSCRNLEFAPAPPSTPPSTVSVSASTPLKSSTVSVSASTLTTPIASVPISPLPPLLKLSSSTAIVPFYAAAPLTESTASASTTSGTITQTILSAAMLQELALAGGQMGPLPNEFAALNLKLKQTRRRMPKKTAPVDASGNAVVKTPPRPRGRPKKGQKT